jgi:hypothetical protein
MKKYILYIVCAALAITGCTKFDEETPIPFVKGPAVAIAVTAATDSSVTFTVTPDAVAGYYSYLLTADGALAAVDSSRLLKLSYDGVAKATVNYNDSTTARIYVKGLVPNTNYRIYAVASNTEGMAGGVANVGAHTGDNGEAPGPKAVNIAGTVVAVTFSEPVVRGEGAVSVTFHAIYAQASAEYNQTVAVPADNVSASGTTLSIKLPPLPGPDVVPAGAYVSITYEAGAVNDLSGTPCAAFTNTGTFNPTTGVFNGITARVATAAWGFEAMPADTLIGIAAWAAGVLTIVPNSAISAPVAELLSGFKLVYKETGKSTTVDVKTADYSPARDTIFLLTAGAEEAGRGAIIDAIIPAGAFADYFGNTNAAFAVENTYRYNYTKAAVLGTYTVSEVSYYGAPYNSTETGIEIADYDGGATDTVLVKNLFDAGTEIKAVFDGTLGTLSIPDDQLLTDNADLGGDTYEIYFYNAEASAPVVFNVPAAGRIASSAWWGYYYYNTADETDEDWFNVFTSSAWTRQ